MNDEHKLLLVMDVCVDGYARGGLATYEGRPCLFLSEFLDYDQNRKSRRLGETFFLVSVDETAARAIVDAYVDPNTLGDGTDAREAAIEGNRERWLAFKTSQLELAERAFRVQGNLRAVATRPGTALSFRPITRQPTTGAAVRERMATIAALEAQSGAGTAESPPLTQDGSAEEMEF